ncbi:MAG: hypothetical protein COB35_02570 [Gammaproteobacteria bacterium]|nr:MAG: hypothetical protein COB35_02570 [Gammaproteobacteria bacterium]
MDKRHSLFDSIIFIAFVLSIILSTSLNAKIVTSKGISDIIEGKKAKTRSIALNSAKRAAVEQVAGAFIQSRSSVNDFVFAQDKIYSSSSGNISSYTILSEGINDFGAYEVEIEADVDVQELLDGIKEILKVNGWSRKPRITLEISSNDGTVANTLISMFTTKLNQNGFEVFDHSKKVQTGFLLSVKANFITNQSDYQGITISSNSLSIVADVKRTDDGQVIASTSFEKSKASSNKAKIVQQLATQLTSRTWSSLKTKILNYWQNEQYVARSIYLDLENINSYQKAQTFSRSLKQSISGLLDVELIKYENQKGIFLLKYKGWPEQLHEEVFSGPLKSEFQLELVSVNSNHVTLRIN